MFCWKAFIVTHLWIKNSSQWRTLILFFLPPLSLLSLSRLHCVVSHVSALHNTVLVLLCLLVTVSMLLKGFSYSIYYIYILLHKCKTKSDFCSIFFFYRRKRALKVSHGPNSCFYFFTLGKGMLGLVCTHPRFCLILVFHTSHQVMNKLHLT